MIEELFLVLFLGGNLIERQLIFICFGRNKPDPVSQLVFFQVLLSQILQILSRKLCSRNNSNSGSVFINDYRVTQVTQMAINLNVFDQVLGVRSWIKNTILCWRRHIYSESPSNLLLSGDLKTKMLVMGLIMKV